jgi:hypothetical protein
MRDLHLESYIGKLVFLRLRDKRWTEAFGLPTDLFLAKVLNVDDTGVWVEWNRYPLVNKGTGERKFFKGELLITHDNIASAFASEEFQRDVEAQAEAQRLAHVEPAGEG